MKLQPLTTARLQLVPPFLEYLDVGGADFDLKPEAAIKYFQAKGLKTTYAWQEMIGTEHSKAFTVAKMMDIDLLGLVRKELDHFIAEGGNFNDFKKTLTPLLQQHGWWGKTKEGVQLGSAWRLATIFRTNMQSAYAVGHWQQIVINAGEAPYLMYDAVDDHRTRPEHAQLDEKVLRWDDPFWKTHYPPNGWNCRCSVVQLSEKQVKDLGLKLGKAPKIKRKKWVNPVTGEKRMVPVDLDPGWDYNPGVGTLSKHQQLLAEKIAQLPQDMQAAVAASQAAQAKVLAADEAMAKASKAKAALAKAVGTQALERSIVKAQQRAVHLKAEAELKAIAAGTANDPGNFKKNAYKQLVNEDGFKAGTPIEQVDKIIARAAKLKEKHGLQTKLSAYKKKVLAGKLPTEAQQEAYKKMAALYPDDLAKFQAGLQKAIDDAKPAVVSDDPIEVAFNAIYKLKYGKAPKASELAGFNNLGDITDKNLFLNQLAGTLNPNQQQVASAIIKATHGKIDDAAGVVAAKVADDVVQAADEYMHVGKFQQIGTQKGSNPGAMYLDPDTNTKWYIKYPANEEIARNEVLAGKLYQAAGVEVPELVLVKSGGKVGVASKIIDGLKQYKSASGLNGKAGVNDAFVVDAWLANWDVVGLNFDNMLVKVNRAIRLDTGGALRYRAQGGMKGAAFGDEVTELKSLLDSSVNRQSAAVFKGITREEMIAGAKRLNKISDDAIRNMVNEYGGLSVAEADKLTATLIARRNYITNKLLVNDELIEKAKQAAVAAARDEVKVQLLEVNSKIVTAIKGIAMRASKGGMLEAKDLERVKDAKAELTKLLKTNNELLTDTSKREIQAFYGAWLDDLAESVKPGAGKPAKWAGGHFDGFKGGISIDEAKVEFTVPKLGEPVRFTDAQANKAIRDLLGEYAARTSVPTGTNIFENVQPNFKRAIHLYTGSHYQGINSALRKGTADAKQLAYRDVVNQGLGDAVPYKGKTTRGIRLDSAAYKKFMNEHNKAYETGGTVEYPAFTSTSKGEKAAFSGNVYLHITSKTGVYVRSVSAHPGENEVLFKAGSKFVVEQINERGHVTEVWLTEVLD